MIRFILKFIYDVYSFFEDIYYNLKRIIRYIPAIWEDRNFDYVFIFKLLKFKIGLVRERTENIKFYVGYEHDAKYMRICERLLEILINDDFSTEDRFEWDFEKQDVYESRCKSLLFKILDKQIFRWWD